MKLSPTLAAIGQPDMMQQLDEVLRGLGAQQRPAYRPQGRMGMDMAFRGERGPMSAPPTPMAPQEMWVNHRGMNAKLGVPPPLDPVRALEDEYMAYPRPPMPAMASSSPSPLSIPAQLMSQQTQQSAPAQASAAGPGGSSLADLLMAAFGNVAMGGRR